VSEWVPDMICNLYLVKNHNIAHSLTNTEAKEKISADLESLEIKKKFDVCTTNFKTDQI
jgi:hypothetical protein